MGGQKMCEASKEPKAFYFCGDHDITCAIDQDLPHQRALAAWTQFANLDSNLAPNLASVDFCSQARKPFRKVA